MELNIIELLYSETIESKIELIEYLLSRIGAKKSNEKFKDFFWNFFLKNVNFPYSKSYSLIGPKYALGCLSSQFLFHYVTEKNSEQQIQLLKTLLTYIKGLQPSTAKLLRKTTTIKLLDRIDEFGLPYYSLRSATGRPLQIYFIPFQHIEVNAAYYPHINSIMSYKPREVESSPEYIFVHEVGHLLINNLTGDPEKLPDSFIEFNKKFNPDWDGDLVEVFVDLFSLAVMMDSDYAPYNPFVKVFRRKEQETIKDYFKELLRRTFRD